MPRKSAPRPTDVPSGRAISIQQPFIEQILRGTKKYEYRSVQTHIRGRVYLYASQKNVESDDWKKMKIERGSLPLGKIVGSVEIVDCEWSEKDQNFRFKLKNPKRYRTQLTPKNRAQPCWFFPFGPLAKNRK